ncbi:zinc finger FYVE domain-containing protein 26-like [Octopus sinensis]|uniref:Zinc finger FYVE domain-containing protein 26-like n=1 Tax=Octopus sinensis TaxID=2607531 RepID=A0A7E6F653_9MOLL|nr:zinc finger FYVE domain-containing protein 26-like [Octopus sinensis]
MKTSNHVAVASQAFPFGNELRESVRLLFRFFCNNIYLGQFELARACVPYLAQHGTHYGVDIGQILKQIVEYPYGRSVGSTQLKSPHHLSWICLLEYLKLEPYELKPSDVETLKRDVEFRILLSDASSATDSNTIQELYIFHKLIPNSEDERMSNDGISQTLSQRTCNFLKELLLTKPELGSAIINHLKCPNKPNLKLHQTMMEQVYISCINRCISAVYSEDSLLSQVDKCDQVYTILSLFNPDNEATVLNLNQTISGLVDLCQRGLVPEDRILSLMASKKKPFLLTQLSDELASSHMNQLITGDKSISKHSELNDNLRQLLTLSKCTDRSSSWPQLYFKCMKDNQHFLESYVEAAISLISSGRFDELKELFEPEELQPLKSLVLLVGWPYCYTCANATCLLEILLESKTPCQHPALDKGCQKLQHQINLIRWCLEKSRSLVHVTDGKETNINPHCQATNIFQGLVNHSMLYVLQQATRLASLREHEVLDLLQKVSLTKTPATDEKKVKTVRFEDLEQDADSEEEPIGIEQERDVALYRSFCILKNVQDAILYGALHAHSRLMNPTYYNIQSSSHNYSWSKDSTLSDASESGSRLSSAAGERTSGYLPVWNSDFTAGDIQQLYNKNVLQKLQNAKNHLRQLYPLAYRVEILENVFSLLFVSHKELQDTFFTTETDDTDDSDEKQSVHDSNENLMNISIQSEEESILSEITHTSEASRDIGSLPLGAAESIEYDVPFVEYSPEELPKIEESKTEVSEPVVEVKKPLPQRQESHVKEAEIRISRFSMDLKTENRNSNTKVTSQFGKPLQIGLLTNEYLVRDILDLLQESLQTLNATNFQLSNTTVMKEENLNILDLEENLPLILPMSINQSSLKSRISKLSQVVSEAQWRFQLVCNDQIPREVGKVLLHVYNPSVDSICDESVRFSDCAMSKKSNKMSSLSEISLTSGEDGEVWDSPGICSEGASYMKSSSATALPSSKKILKKPRSRSRTPSMSSVASVSRRLSSGIIQDMLLSNRALLVKCLKQGKFIEAHQVIKLFKMEDSAEVAEVTFLEAFLKAVNQIQAYCKQAHNLSLSDFTSTSKDSMKQLASVAAAGVATATISSCAAELLSISVYPHLPTPQNIASLVPNYSAFFSADNLSAMILFDLACSACKTYDTSSMILESIKAHMHAKKRTSSGLSNKDMNFDFRPSKECKILGFPGFLDMLEWRVQLSDDVETCLLLETSKALANVFADSIQTILTSSEFPFLPKRCKQYLEANKSLQLAVVSTWEQFLVNQKYFVMKKKISWKHKNIIASETVKNSDGLYSIFEMLLMTMEKHRENIGVYSFLTRQISSNSLITNYKNYLLSLYKHTQILANLLNDNEPNSSETAIMKNYFKVLDEGPVITIGKMMFGKRIPPHKLEKVAEDLSLNLTHVIVHNCCPKILSKHQSSGEIKLPCHDLSGNSFGGVIVLNNKGASTSSSNAEKDVRTILTNLVHAMKDLSPKHSGKNGFNADCLQEAVKSTRISKTLDKTVNFRDIDLSQLNQIELTCFLTNLVNVLIIHSYMYIAIQAEQQQCWDTLKEMLHAGSHSGLWSDNNSIDRIIWLSRYGYQVGQLGIVSIFDLRYILLRNGLPRPGLLGGLLEDRIDALDICDPWSMFTPRPDYRITFVISNGYTSSPPLQVLTPELLSHQLEIAERSYLSNTVSVNVSSAGHSTVLVPDLLCEYQHDFPSSEEAKVYYNSPWEELLLYIRDHADTELATKLTDFLENPTTDRDSSLKVLPQTNDTKFLYIFDPSHLKKVMEKSERSHTVSLNHEQNIKYNASSSKLEADYSMFKLTSNALEYIKSESPLVATLVSLVCHDDLDSNSQEDSLEEDEQANDDESWMKSKSSVSDISLVDIKSYRYQKLSVDFPVLKQRLLQNIIPLVQTEHSDVNFGDEALLKFMSSEISCDIKMAILSLPDSKKYLSVVSRLLNECIHSRKWLQALNIIDSLPVTLKQENGDFILLHDFVLCCLAKKACDEEDKKLEAYAKMFYNSEIQVRTILNIVRGLPLKKGIELLEACLSKELSVQLRSAVISKLKQLKIFCKVSECVSTVEKRASFDCTGIAPYEKENELSGMLQCLHCWTDIPSLSTSNPASVLSVILEAEDFDTAREWADFFSVDLPLLECIEMKEIMFFLSHGPSDPKEAFMALEKMQAEDEYKCLRICNGLMESLNRQQDILFIASYMLNYLESNLDPQRQEQLRLTCIGAKALLCLPNSIRGEYRHLVSAPQLLLEQLLMNMKADLAGQVFSKIQNDFRRIQDCSLCFSIENFDDLVAKYATKALEFPIVQVLIQGKDRSQSRLSLMSDRQDLDSVSVASKNHQSETGSTRMRRRGSDTSLNRSPGKNMDNHQHRSVGTTGSKYLSLNLGTGSKFQMPPEPPHKDQWVPDSTTAVCMVCRVERFSMFNRRHHCRRCGRLVCRGCSGRTTLIFGMIARTCDDCFEQISRSSMKDENDRTPYRPKDSQSRSSDEPLNYSPSLTSFAPKDHFSFYDLAGAIRQTEHPWKLKLDPDYNSDLLEEFYYEQAPSASLCISILNVHSDPRKCGELILKLCDDLSKLLKPISPGMANSEIDYSLVISMMRHLLFHAKVRFTRCMENRLMILCDQYSTLVDLLKVLLASNYPDLPSIQELTKSESVTRLRDKLIEVERLPLAMEVSTKCGLDATGVWAAWGRACLRFRNYPLAREKFARCLKPPRDRNLTQHSNALLMEVVECLESMPNRESTEVSVKDFSLSKSDQHDIINESFSRRFSEESNLDKVRFEECAHYLEIYGTYTNVVDFYRRNGHWFRAIQFILDHQSSPEVFEESLLIPALKSGNLRTLLDKMLVIDTSLEKWNVYFTSACRYLLNHKLYHVLYEVQLFMKDFIRASMTCTRYFYLGSGQSYGDLASGINCLYEAEKHLHSYLEPSQWGNVPKPHFLASLSPGATPQKSSSLMSTEMEETAVRLIKVPSEVQKQILRIRLQIEVTKFLEACLNKADNSAANVAASYLASHKYGAPTLFGNAQIRMDLVTMILLSCDGSEEDRKEGYDIVLRIIKEYRLDKKTTFCHVGRGLVKLHRYNDIKFLVNWIAANKLGDSRMCDAVIDACLIGIADKRHTFTEMQLKESGSLIDYIKADSNKINAYILLGKLKTAYLLAVKSNNTEEIRRIGREASRVGQMSVKNICDRYLLQQKP